ncbi:MAG: cobalamin-dependent protein [Spirochaetales bacterium]|nr:cobalamin-dependent protein [Spirochaetales bacterium]
MRQKLIQAIVDMKEAEALALVNEMLNNGIKAMDVLSAVKEAMDIVGKKYEEGSFFLPELILAGEILNQISQLVKTNMRDAVKTDRHGKVLIGTVKGDIHDIGKDIVTFMLDVNGFDVMDLGVDVAPEKFIQAIKDFQPKVVGLSGFLTLAFDAMKDLIAEIDKAGLRDKVKIMIGGGQMDEQVKEYTGADAYGKDAMSAVRFAKSWIGG